MCPKEGVLAWGFRPSHPLVGANASRSHRALRSIFGARARSAVAIRILNESSIMKEKRDELRLVFLSDEPHEI